ncbi:MAG: serine/threonine-protein kinase [Aquabacterium sp.]|nr:serine/threonine-protein kinase [Aquabacterium sp.]
MLPPHWKTLQLLLDEALDAAPADRPALLQRWRLEFPDRIDDLQQLLHSLAQAESDQFLGSDAAAAGLFGLPLAGQRLGAYTLQEPIGEGGMGSVWLARRDDGRFEGLAAVKLLAQSMTGAGRAERFRREGHILARLAHPHIARLLDAGVSPSGQPYLVLEHVQGQHIDAHCNTLQLGVTARVQLFLTLLDAVQHAHAHLVVHRDIKPSNVMVDADGQLKLLDFGIAKLLVTDPPTGGACAAPLTQQAGAMLSPGFAAPEQLQSGEVSTATDVYALGVLLYLLLSGHHPTTRPGSSAAQALQDTLQRDPPPMSLAVRGDDGAAAARGLRASALPRALAGDLDTITAKALRRLPGERYATAAALADDLRRHLAQQPVLAQPPSAAYLLGRFLQRHRLPAAATLAGVVVLAAAGQQAWQAQQAARLSQTQAQTVDGLLQSLFNGMGPDVAANRSFSALELLDRGQIYLDTQADLNPATRRATRLRMATLFRDVGAYPQAAAAFRAEADAARQAGQPDALALALWQQANVALKTLDTATAAQLLATLTQVLADHPQHGRASEARLALLRGELALVSRRSADALPALAQAEALFHTLPDLEFAARAAQGQGTAARQAGDLAAARQHLQRSVDLQARRGDSAVVDRVTAALDLASLQNTAGAHAAAVDLLTPLHADLQARLGPQHPHTASAVAELALAELRQGHWQALDHWLAALRAPADAADGWRADHAAVLAAMAQAYQGQAAAAEPALRQLLAALLRDEGGITAATEPVRRLHAEALLRQGRLREAEATLRTTQTNQLGLGQADHPSVAATQVLLGVALARQGDVPAAYHLWAEAATVLARALGPDHPQAVAAACYAALAAQPGSPQAGNRPALAAQLQQILGWQDGAADLAAALRSQGPPTDWRHLPVVL